MSGPASSENVQTVLVWFRRDLRVDDNPALVAALQSASCVIPVFVWAPEEEGQFQPGRCSRWWLKQSLGLFQQQLRGLGSDLIIREGTESSDTLLQLAKETGASALFFNHLYDPISLVRDHEVKQRLTEAGIECRSYNADLWYEPWEVLDDAEQPFTSFDAFWSRILTMPYQPPFPLPAPAALSALPPGVQGLQLPQVSFFMTPEQEASSEQLKFKWQPGIEGAVLKLDDFIANKMQVFEHDRAKVDRNSTSQLSPWIHIGTISVRYIYYRVRQCQEAWLAQGIDRTQSCLDFLQQMGYREYSRYLSFHFPFIHERALLAHLRACPWRFDQQGFKAWKMGMTGYPLIDAGMKQLWSTGWVHNRIRVVAASFLVKNLLLPWQWGLKHYWDALLDADLECDALGWQYVAGCLSDAHPFTYMIDMQQESRRFDPDGEFVRRWLPALARLPTEYIHAPWTAPAEVLEAADVELGMTYPHRVSHEEESRVRVLNAWQVIEDNLSPGQANNQPFRPATVVVAPGSVPTASTPAGAAMRRAVPSSSQPTEQDVPHQALTARQHMLEHHRQQQLLHQHSQQQWQEQQAAAAGAQQEPAGMLWQQQGAASTSDSVMDSDAGSSEEVVSNVVQDSAAQQPSASSALPPRSFKRPAASNAPGRTVPTMSASGTPLGTLSTSGSSLLQAQLMMGAPSPSIKAQQEQLVPRLRSVGAAEDGSSDGTGTMSECHDAKRLRASDSTTLEAECHPAVGSS